MRKQFVSVILLLALTLLLAGCGSETTEPTTVPVETEAVTEPTESPAAAPAATEKPKPTEPPATEPPATEPPATEPPATEPPATEETKPTAPVAKSEQELPYLLNIPTGQSIFTEPHYDSQLSMVLGNGGIYTIVEETVDNEGNLWGKMKSGVGWVDLTEIQQNLQNGTLLSANYADDQLLNRGGYHHYACGREYSVPIAFRANGTLRDVVLFYYELGSEGYIPGENFYTLAELTEKKPLVAELDFPGDMTTYGIRFTDENNNVHVFQIYQSLRNGTLVLQEK